MHRERVPTWLQDRQDQHFGHTALLKSFQSARKCLSFKLVTISRSSFSPSTCRAPHQPHRPVISSIISSSDICNTCFASYEAESRIRITARKVLKMTKEEKE